MIGVELRQTGGRSQIVELAMTGEKRRTRHGWESRTGELVTTGAVEAAGGKILIDVKAELLVVGC